MCRRQRPPESAWDDLVDVDGLLYQEVKRVCLVISMALRPEVNLLQLRALRRTRLLVHCYPGSASSHRKPARDRRSRRHEVQWAKLDTRFSVIGENTSHFSGFDCTSSS